MKIGSKAMQLILGVITCIIIVLLTQVHSKALTFQVERIGTVKQSIILVTGTSANF